MCNMRCELTLGKHWTRMGMYDLEWTKNGLEGTGRVLWELTAVDKKSQFNEEYDKDE